MDSKGWYFQVWVAFIVAIGGYGWLIYQSPIHQQLKIWMGIGFMFTVAATLNLAKTLRDVHEFGEDDHSPLWLGKVVIAFTVAVGGSMWGIYSLDFTQSVKIMMCLCVLFAVSASASLAKTMRDKSLWEQNRAIADKEATQAS